MNRTLIVPLLAASVAVLAVVPEASAADPPAASADAGAVAIVIHPVLTPPAFLGAQLTKYRALPATDAAKARTAKIALYRRLASMPASDKVDLLALARSETASAFGASLSANDVAAVGVFVLVDTLNGVQDDTKELSEARDALIRERARLAAITAKQPPRTPTTEEVNAQLATSSKRRTANFGVEYPILGVLSAPPVEALKAAGASSEQIRLLVLNSQLKRLQDLYEMLSAILKTQHQQATIAIQNLRG